MGQSMTLFRVSADTFEQLEKAGTSRRFNIASPKSSATFQKSFMGLEYVLCKGQDEQTAELLKEIFAPKDILGKQEFETLSPEEQFELYESGSFIHYLNTTKISKIIDLLNQVTEADLHARYDVNELNNNDIYPWAWHNDNSVDKGFNLRHLTEDFIELKTIFQQALIDKDYLFVFVE